MSFAKGKNLNCDATRAHLRCNYYESVRSDVGDELAVEHVLQGEAVVELHHRVLSLVLRQCYDERFRWIAFVVSGTDAVL